MPRRLALSLFGAMLAALIAWAACKLISPAIVSSLGGAGDSISPTARYLLGQNGPTFFSILVSLLFGFLLCSVCTFAHLGEPNRNLRIRRSLAAGVIGGVGFSLSTIFCESAATWLLENEGKGGFIPHRLFSETREYIEWAFWLLQSVALCAPVYWSIGVQKRSLLQLAAVVFASAAGISIVMFLLQAFLVIFSYASMNLTFHNLVKHYKVGGLVQFPNPEYLLYQQNFYLLYTLAFAVCLGVLFAIVPVNAQKAWLALKNGSQIEKSWEIRDVNMAIGSDPMCNICCNQVDGFAACHARVHRYGNEFILKDLGSPTGTLVNGKRVTRASLKDGDKIQLGNQTFEFTTNDLSAHSSKLGQPSASSSVPSLAPLRQAALGVLVDSFGNRYALNQDLLSVGRAKSCTICLSWEPTVSMHHADIVRDSNAYRIVDRQSSNLTKVNGIPVTQSTILADGDTVELGSAKLRFEVEKPAAIATV